MNQSEIRILNWNSTKPKLHQPIDRSNTKMCWSKPESNSLAPYYEGILDTPPKTNRSPKKGLFQ